MQGKEQDPVGRLARAFASPADEFRPVIFWVWNSLLDDNRIRAQLEDIKSRGFGGVVIHPMGEAFRLGDFIRGMSPPYLSDEYFGLVATAVRRAAALGLSVWLYDEGGWPSGSAQGEVVEGRPDLCSRVLTCRPVPEGEGAEAAAVVAVCAVTEEGDVRAVPSVANLPPGTAHVLAFEERVFEDGYPDLMNPEAGERFLGLTHERYAAVVGDYFGSVIPGMFTDEARVRGTVGGAEAPWSPALPARLAQLGPDDWRSWLPTLFGADALGFDPFEVLGEAAVVQGRCGYCEAVARQFEESYWLRLNRWCEDHGLIHTGHVGGEDNLPDHVNGGFFQWFRTAGALHAPGVDTIWRQLMPGQLNSSFPLLAGSALHARAQGAAPPADQSRAALTVSESYAVYGYGATFAQYGWVANYQFVQGINRVWPMAYYYSTADGQAYGTMSHLGPGNPLWPHWRGFNAYLARLGAVVAHSGHACDIAVYYPIEAEWAYHGRKEAASAWDTWQQCCECLHQAQMAFDLVDAPTLSRAHIAEGCLETDGQSYSTVIVPDCSVIPGPVMERLRALHDAGGRVVFVENMPRFATSRPDQARLRQTSEYLDSLAFVLDEKSEREQWSTAGGRVAEGSAASALDGAAAALLGPGGWDVYAPQALRSKAVLVAPEEELPRLGHLLSLALGHYVLEPVDPLPHLRMSSRWLAADQWVHLLFNEGGSRLRARLAVISEEPLCLERWDPLSGRSRHLARHVHPIESTRIELELAPGELVVLTTQPLAEGSPGVPARARRLVLESFRQAAKVLVVAECVLEGGSMKVVEDLRPIEGAALVPWRRMGLDGFAGTVRYHFGLAVAEAYLQHDLHLELGTVEYAASVYVNGQWAGDALWPPYHVHLQDLLRAGHNELVVEVGNTLAGQVLRHENVQEAAARAWNNPYYRRTLEWHRESLGGGLLGPVRLVALVE